MLLVFKDKTTRNVFWIIVILLFTSAYIFDSNTPALIAGMMIVLSTFSISILEFIIGIFKVLSSKSQKVEYRNGKKYVNGKEVPLN